MKIFTSLAAALLASLFLAFLPLPFAAAKSTAPIAANPSVAAVQQYLDARAAGQTERAYALLSPATQKMLPLSQQQEMMKQITAPGVLATLPPGLLPVIALFADFHDTLHFKFRVLGPSPDVTVVLVRAYQVGTPLSTIKTLQVATVQDPDAGGAWRLDGQKTVDLTAPAARKNAEKTTSLSNLKQIALGVIQYTQDHDERLPDAASWVDEVMPYIKSEAVFHDPAAPDSEKWSYAFNSTLSHISLAQLDAPAQTAMLFESTLGVKNAADTGQSVPLPGRHSGGTDYALADGHVKWLPDNTKLSYQLSGK